MSSRKAAGATWEPSGPLNLLGNLLCRLPEFKPVFGVGAQGVWLFETAVCVCYNISVGVQCAFSPCCEHREMIMKKMEMLREVGRNVKL